MIKEFKDLGIQTTIKTFFGEKIKMKKILNHEIIIIDFKIENSKFEGEYTNIQIQKEDIKHVVFTTSKYLRQNLEKMKPDDFPFRTRIVEIEDRFEFT